MSDLTYVEEPRIALAPGAHGGLVITATAPRPYVDNATALAIVRDRLPMVVDVDWLAARVELRGRRRYVMFVPPAARPHAEGETAGLVLHSEAGTYLERLTCTDEEAERVLEEGTLQRLDMALADLKEETAPALRAELSAAYETFDQWKALGSIERRALYDRAESILRRIFTRDTTPTDPPVERKAS